MYWIVLANVAVLAIALCLYAYNNLNYDKRNPRLAKAAGFIEKTYMLPDGDLLNYGEGPDGGQPLFLIHGQMTNWEDYAPVLKQLSRYYHVFAIDCHGHGKSVKNTLKYQDVTMVEDFSKFLKDVVKEPVIVSGHSSGALLSALLAAMYPNLVKAILLEDGPFFSTEPDRAPKTISWLGFKTIADFLNQDEETNYTKYNLAHNYTQTFFNKDGNDYWKKIIVNPALKYMEKNPGRIPRLWYYPRLLGVNLIYDGTANLQDGTGEYDLNFGRTFYDFSWFDGFDQAKTLSQVHCPALFLHVDPSKLTAPSYYDENGILLAAMDEKDAAHVVELLPHGKLIDGFESMPDIHADFPKEFANELIRFGETLAR